MVYQSVYFLAYCVFITVVLAVSTRPLLSFSRKIFVYHKEEEISEKVLLFATWSAVFILIALIILLFYTSIISLFGRSITIAQMTGVAFFFALLTTISRISALAYRESKIENGVNDLSWKRNAIQSTYYSFLMTLLFLGLLGNAGLFATSDTVVDVTINGTVNGQFFIQFSLVIVFIIALSVTSELVLGAERSPWKVPEKFREEKPDD